MSSLILSAQESVAQDLAKILYQVLTRLYRDLVRPSMGGAKRVVDDFDWDRVCGPLSGTGIRCINSQLVM